MKKRLVLLLFSLVLLFNPSGKATHIVGAELTYDCLGNNNYRFKLVLYRDCLNGTAGFDNPITLFLFEHNTGTLVNTFTANLLYPQPQIEPENWNACVGSPYNICVEVGTYETDYYLPPIPGGYDVAWARCCRNFSITNLANPECEGVTFLAHVPGSDAVSVCNNMPEFNNYPPIFLCAGQPFYFDHSATDSDGDSLSYEISNPYTGLNFAGMGAGNGGVNCPGSPLPPTVSGANLMGPEPYNNVVYGPGYSYLNPFGSGFVSINSTTGYLVAQPNNPGIYVLAISVKEYRNGILLSENKRDFQFHAISCIPQNPPPVLTHNLSGLNSSGDTIFIEAGQPFCYTFEVTDSIIPSTIVVTPISTSFGGNGGFPPPYATLTLSGSTPPVTGTICWTPPCNYVGQNVPMIISARDTNDCANYNIIFDTVWIHVLPSPSIPPLVFHDFTGLNYNGDTILVNVQEPFCYDFMIVDTLGTGQLAYQNILYDSIGIPANQVQVVTTTISGDTIFGTVCWNGYCNFDRVYHFVTTGTDQNQCAPGNSSTDTVWIRILAPDNPPPTISTDISANTLNNDTIIARVHEEVCFNFTVIDTTSNPAAWDSLGFSYFFESYPGGVVTTSPSTYYVTASGNGDTLTGQICWTPTCPNVDLTWRCVITGIQINICFITNSISDTVYLHVIEPLKPPPAIGHTIGPISPDNQNVTLQDDQEFCYDFFLSDTLMPTYLTYTPFIELGNGQAYTGPMPVVTYTLQLDSMVQGTICWTVPCEFAGQNFRLIGIGVDTFDCHPGNTVYDTVFVTHIENPPSKVDMCRITVLPGDASIEINWRQLGDSDADRYYIFRKREDEISYSFLDSTINVSDTSFIDNTGLLADEYVYCYKIIGVDRCGYQSVLFDEACSMLLTGTSEGYSANIEWTPYIGWPNGIASYDIQTRDGTQSGTPFSLTGTTAGSVHEWEHNNILHAITCYRVNAWEQDPGCGVQSFSNEICLVFPSTLFIPNAFTPNGDGTNDIFIIPAEFLEYFHLMIFNRWGELIYESSNQSEGWNATYKGQDVPEGTYVFRVEGQGYDKKWHVANGNVTVIR